MLACALKMGAIMGNAPEADAEALYQFGINIGLAFQLQDDLLDVYGDTATFGKNIGGDILCNKKTFMLIQRFTPCFGYPESGAEQLDRQKDIRSGRENRLCDSHL